MTQHDHEEYRQGCYRCELGAAEEAEGRGAWQSRMRDCDTEDCSKLSWPTSIKRGELRSQCSAGHVMKTASLPVLVP